MGRREFQHLLLTRFNLEAPNVSFSKGLDESWLLHRMGLFEQFCLPSVMAQSNKAFRWILMVHPRTPPAVRRSLDAVTAACGELTIFETPVCGPKALNEIVGRFANLEYVVTSRLDNDDAIATDFIDRVQRAFVPQDGLFISFPKFAVYDMATNRFYTRRYVSNAYLSVIETRSGRVRTILGYRHPSIKNRFRVRKVRTDQHMALTVIHDRNIGNSVKGKAASSAQVLKHFSVGVSPTMVSALRDRVRSSIKAFLRRGGLRK